MSLPELEVHQMSKVEEPSFKKTTLSRDITEALGRVPTVRLNRISYLCKRHDLHVKLEACNPGGSIKEKNAAYLILDAEEQGALKPGGTIVESSSGNFGIGLAMIGASRGYRVIIVVDAKTPPPMRGLLKAYGAELVDVPLSFADASGSMQVARMKKAEALASGIPGAWYPCQHKNPKNPMAHGLWTAREIEEAFNGPPDIVAIGVSTAGQIAGISRYFRRRHPNTKIVAVDVAGSAIFGTPRHPYKMTGLGLSFVPPNFTPELLDAAYSIDDELAFSMCHLLAKKEGLLLGASTGAIVAATLAYCRTILDRKKVAIVNPDHGNRYLETVYSEDWLNKQGLKVLSSQEIEDAIEDLVPVDAGILRGGKNHGS